jgi:hypothetical protein
MQFVYLLNAAARALRQSPRQVVHPRPGGGTRTVDRQRAKPPGTSARPRSSGRGWTRALLTTVINPIPAASDGGFVEKRTGTKLATDARALLRPPTKSDAVPPALRWRVLAPVHGNKCPPGIYE